MVSGRRRLMGMAAASALGVSCLAAVGCGSGGSAVPDPLASQTAARVLAKALANLKAAPSVTVNSTGIDSGLYVSGYMRVDPRKGCTGTTTVETQRTWAAATYVTIGQTVYFKPNSLMWAGLAGSGAAAIAQQVGDRYVEAPMSDGHLIGIGNCDVTGLHLAGGPYTKSQVTTLNGIRVLPIKDSRGGVMYVTDTSEPQIAQYDVAPLPGGTGPAGEITYTFGASVDLTPPPASQVIRGASIGL
jgi:hypothetical protein